QPERSLFNPSSPLLCASVSLWFLSSPFSPLVGLEARRRGLRLRLARPQFQPDVTAVAEVPQFLQDARVVDLAGARLVAPGVVGDLHVAELWETVADVAAQVAFGDVVVVEVEQDLHVRRADRLDESHTGLAAVEAVALVIDADVHRLQDQG